MVLFAVCTMLYCRYARTHIPSTQTEMLNAKVNSSTSIKMLACARTKQTPCVFFLIFRDRAKKALKHIKPLHYVLDFICTFLPLVLVIAFFDGVDVRFGCCCHSLHLRANKREENRRCWNMRQCWSWAVHLPPISTALSPK